MSSKKIVVVFGATGNQGGSLIKAILGDSLANQQFQLRAITRNPSSETAMTIAAKGVEVVKADLGDRTSLEAALKDSYAVFAVTNWQEILNKDTEIQYGKNIADVAKGQNVQHLIWSSLPNVTKNTNSKLTGVLHFDSKATVEEYIRSLALPATFFIPSVFNHYAPLQLRPIDADNKTYMMVSPLKDTTNIPYISIASDAGKYLKAILLDRSKFLGKTVLAAEREYNSAEVVQILKNKGGLDVVYHQMSYEDFGLALEAMGMPGWLADDMCQTLRYFEDYGYFAGEDFEKWKQILTESLQTFEEWVSCSKEIEALK